MVRLRKRSGGVSASTPPWIMLAVVPLALVTGFSANEGSSVVHPAKPDLGLSGAYVYTEAARWVPDAWLNGGDRIPGGARLVLFDSKVAKALVPEFVASADPEVSFDGRRVLFSGKRKRGDSWQIWEINLSDRSLRQFTSGSEDSVSPHYLPDENLVYARRLRGAFRVEARPLASRQALPITYGPGNYLPRDVLADGRVLVESSHPIGAGKASELYTVYPDGSGIEAYRCDHKPHRSAGRQLASGDLVFEHEARLARFTSALAHDVPVKLPLAEYAGPIAENAKGNWVIALRRPGQAHFELDLWDAGKKVLEPLQRNPGAHCIQPVSVAPRRVPRRFPSALMAQRGGGNLLCLNAYESPLAIPASSVSTARFYTLDDTGKQLVLGDAKVEADGSFYVRVPFDRPVRLELLDRSGQIVRAERGWFWMRRGEQRICVGCHAGPERAPENAVPAVLLHTQKPVSLEHTSGGHE